MIRLTDRIPPLSRPEAELLKIRCTAECYPDIGLFWEQDDGKCYLSMLDGNMVIANYGGDTGELAEFVGLLSPCCVFSDLETLTAIGLLPDEAVCVMCRKADIPGCAESDRLSSGEIYRLLDVDGLSLPEYEYFAVDFCRRLNHGQAQYFALRDKCAAISLHSGEFALMNGIASHEKGYGTRALTAILQLNYGRSFLVCCRESVRGFYEKNGFYELYKSAYWVRNK